MYRVVNWCQQGDEKSYAVMNITTGAVEVIAEKDMKLLTFVGMKLQTISGEEVRMNGDTLVCNVDEFVPAEDTGEGLDEDDGVDWEDFEDDSDESGDSEGTDEEGDDWGDYSGDEEDQSEDSEDDDTDDWADFEAAYGDDAPTLEDSKVNILYKMLQAPQLDVVRKYYLWYSRRLFEGDKDKVEKFDLTNAAARQALNDKLLEQAEKHGYETAKQLTGDEDFHYAGFLDMAPAGGWHCDLGHALRYVHIAWDIRVKDADQAFIGQTSTADYIDILKRNGCMVFGSHCVTEFFGVPEGVEKLLSRVQRDSISDLSILSDLYSEGRFTLGDVEEVKRQFSVFYEIRKKTAKLALLKHPVFQAKSLENFDKFVDVGLIPPKSLVQEFRSCILGWTDGASYFSNKWYYEFKYPTEEFYDRLPYMVGTQFSDVISYLKSRRTRIHIKYKEDYRVGSFNVVERLLSFIYVLFTYESCGFYKYNAVHGENTDEGGRSKDAKRLLDAFYRASLHNVVQGGGFNFDTLRSLLKFVSICKKVEDSHKDGDYALTYFSSMYEKQSETKLDSWGSSRLPTNYKRIVDEYIKVNGNGDRVYLLYRLMTTIVHQRGDMMSRLLTERMILSFTELKSFVDNNGQFEVVGLATAFQKMVAEFDDLYAKLKVFATELADIEEDKHNEKKFDEEQRKEQERKEREAAAEKARREREFEEGDRRLSEIERSVGAGVASVPATRDELIQYLQNKDLSAYNLSGEAEFARNKILRSLGRQRSAVSDSQFWYLQVLYREASGVDYAGAGALSEKPGKQKSFTDLSTRQDIVDAIDWVTKNQFAAETIADAHNMRGFDTFVSILGTIKRTGRISEKQMRYAEVALEIAKEGKS